MHKREQKTPSTTIHTCTHILSKENTALISHNIKQKMYGGPVYVASHAKQVKLSHSDMIKNNRFPVSLMHKMEYLTFWAPRFQCKSESCCVWPLVLHTEPDDRSLPSICVTAQSCVTHSCLVVFICLPPQASSWQLCSSYKKSAASPLLHDSTSATPPFFCLTPKKNSEEDWVTTSGEWREGTYGNIVPWVKSIREFKVGSPFVFLRFLPHALAVWGGFSFFFSNLQLFQR